jgi:hypothetical protein
MTRPPDLTPEQREAALAKAAEARTTRADVRKRLSEGALTLQGVFDEAEENELVAGMKVKAALTALPGLGKIKTIRLMERLEIAENRRIRGLGSRQRQALLDAMADRDD